MLLLATVLRSDQGAKPADYVGRLRPFATRNARWAGGFNAEMLHCQTELPNCANSSEAKCALPSILLASRKISTILFGAILINIFPGVLEGTFGADLCKELWTHAEPRIRDLECETHLILPSSLIVDYTYGSTSNASGGAARCEVESATASVCAGYVRASGLSTPAHPAFDT